MTKSTGGGSRAMDRRTARAFAKLQEALGADSMRSDGLPALALSIRQPWAWCIFHARPIKDVENRSWDRVPRSWLARRGRIAIHAARGMTRREYENCRIFVERMPAADMPRIVQHQTERAGSSMRPQQAQDVYRTCGHGSIQLPPAYELLRGGIIGSVEVFGIVEQSDSPWFAGPLGLMLRDPRPCEFIPSRGRLGYFAWERGGEPPKTPRWMLLPRQLDMVDWLDVHQPAPMIETGNVL